jgi:hypothetical protein
MRNRRTLKSGAAAAQRKKKGAAPTRKKLTKRPRSKGLGVERESGPRGWLMPILESAYTKLMPKGEPEGAVVTAAAAAAGIFLSALQPGRGEIVPKFCGDIVLAPR